MKSNTNIQRSHKSTGVKHIVRGGGDESTEKLVNLPQRTSVVPKVDSHSTESVRETSDDV